MSLYSIRQDILTQLASTRRLLKDVEDHPIMSVGLREKIENLEYRLKELPSEINEPKIKVLFNGNAVMGSIGIKSSFASKTLNYFQEILKTQIAILKYGSVGGRGQAKSLQNTELYLTSLPHGSFGIELSQIESNDLFDQIDVSKAMKQVIHLIEDISKDDDSFGSVIEGTPKRTLNNIEKFLQEIVDENSIVKMECGEVYTEISRDKVKEAFERVSEYESSDSEVFINGIFRGAILDSWKFEAQSEDGLPISGFINEDVEENSIITFDKEFINKQCVLHIIQRNIKFKTGREKTTYELLEIKIKQ